MRPGPARGPVKPRTPSEAAGKALAAGPPAVVPARVARTVFRPTSARATRPAVRARLTKTATSAPYGHLPGAVPPATPPAARTPRTRRRPAGPAPARRPPAAWSPPFRRNHHVRARSSLGRARHPCPTRLPSPPRGASPSPRCGPRRRRSAPTAPKADGTRHSPPAPSAPRTPPSGGAPSPPRASTPYRTRVAPGASHPLVTLAPGRSLHLRPAADRRPVMYRPREAPIVAGASGPQVMWARPGGRGACLAGSLCGMRAVVRSLCVTWVRAGACLGPKGSPRVTGNR